MYDLLREIGAKTIVELGVRWGNSTVALLIYCHCNDSKLYSVDIESCDVAKSIIKALGLEGYWTFTQMDDMEYVNTWSGMDTADRTIDFLFIDTDHTYDSLPKRYINIMGLLEKEV